LKVCGVKVKSMLLRLFASGENETKALQPMYWHRVHLLTQRQLRAEVKGHVGYCAWGCDNNVMLWLV